VSASLYLCAHALAYVGPGAGFAFLGSFLVLLVALVLAVLSVLLLPLRIAVAALTGRAGVLGAGGSKRVVIVGLDGLDPGYLRGMMADGTARNLASLAEAGVFSDLRTTCPAISPVAWSSFATGVNPGKHNIFDFLGRDLRTCIPELSSCRIRTARRSGLLRRARAEISLLRGSQPFWKVLGDKGVFSTVLRVPITFPPEKFRGLSLAGMCVPDLRGTQGSFTLYEEAGTRGEAVETREGPEGGSGVCVPVALRNGRMSSRLSGPAVGARAMDAPFSVRLDSDRRGARLRVGGETVRLRVGEYSPWMRVKFRRGLRTAAGICRFLLVSADPVFRLYVTPINIDPERPAMPLSHPPYYSAYLAKLHGPFATLGLAEDTWGLSSGALDDASFLRQTIDIHEERRRMFFDALRRTRRGMCCCVFDMLDRVQHMFYRDMDEEHPAHRPSSGAAGDPVREAYRRADELVGDVMKELRKGDLLVVLSDHGFGTFRCGVNLNRWLEECGWLKTRPDASGEDCLRDVDWERTKAYSFGLAGIYLNRKGRERRGVVDEEEALSLKREIARGLLDLRDAQTNEPVVSRVYDSRETYSGPYRDAGPDLVVGFLRGYRISWETARGRVAGDVLTRNAKPWSGDHCMDPALVPGVLLSNRKLDLTRGTPHIMDIAPTVLGFFGISRPAYMDGLLLAIEEAAA